MEAEERNTSVDATSSSDDDNSPEPATELMVTSRARRTTAGNRYSTLIAQEETEEDAEDEVAMLFAEGEGEDDDFNSDEGDDEADMSSSDDDDQGPNAVADDAEGENEIQKEAKAERARKRKADLALTTTSSLKKKPKFDPTALRRAPVAKPSKRKERVSWLPESNAAPGRTSLRKQTILHRAETHAKMKENEEQRLKMKAKREKREREREAVAPRELTQADRLAEAERVERRNAKSLNRWEAMEKKRAEEQAAKLAALKERSLEGAVVTWYSSSAKYYGLKETKEVESEQSHEPKKRGRKPKALLEQLAAAKLASTQAAVSTNLQNPSSQTPMTSQVATNSDPPTPTSIINTQTLQESGIVQNSENTIPTQHANILSTSTENRSQDIMEVDSVKSESKFLSGIHEYASMQSDRKARDEPEKSSTPTSIIDAAASTHDTPQPVQVDTKSPENEALGDHYVLRESITVIAPEPSQVKMEASEASQDGKANVAQVLQMNESSEQQSSTLPAAATPALGDIRQLEESQKLDGPNELQQSTNETNINSPLPTSADTTSSQSHPPHPTSNASDSTPPPPPIEVISTRNLIILNNFDDLPDSSQSGTQLRQDYTLFFNTRRSAKPTKHTPELCPVTGLPARYRDPATGMGYATAAAYKKIQELREHRFVWSSMFGCYVGRTNTVARGAPEGFMG